MSKEKKFFWQCGEGIGVFKESILKMLTEKSQGECQIKDDETEKKTARVKSQQIWGIKTCGLRTIRYLLLAELCGFLAPTPNPQSTPWAMCLLD